MTPSGTSPVGFSFITIPNPFVGDRRMQMTLLLPGQGSRSQNPFVIRLFTCMRAWEESLARPYDDLHLTWWT